MPPLSRRFVLAASFSIAACLGCGDGRPTRVPVSGQVTIDGQPLQFGSVLFKIEGGRSAGASLDKDGRYQLTTYEPGDGVMVGDYKVAITGNEPIGETAAKWHAPKKYQDVTTSGLTATIDGPRDDLDFELTWDGGKPFVEKF